MGSVTTKDLDFSEAFILTVKREGHLTAIVGYFDVQFGCPNEVTACFDHLDSWVKPFKIHAFSACWCINNKQLIYCQVTYDGMTA